MRNEYKIKRITAQVLEKAEKTMQAELDALEDWLNGEVYAWAIKDECGNYLDGCSGYLDEEICQSDLQEVLSEYGVEAA
ncbi:hypothetical protein [Moraxella caviae]|uniref:hypothetical protein n=1 Tax=Moraxella caviae TaxID=34060 RepID=UPI0011811D4C|nr:hypothetical protein [Moraxella caviae]